MSYIDFAALKASVRIEQVVALLGLQMHQEKNQIRGICPVCKSNGDRDLVVTPSKNAFYCFGSRAGGDLITLAAHIKGISPKDAAVFIQAEVQGTVLASTSTTSTAKTVPEEREPDARLEKVAARLEHEHPEVQAIGISPANAEALGIGYDRKGIMRGRVLFPLYKDGELAGFIGYAGDLEPALKLPPNLTEAVPANVVQLQRKGGVQS